MVKNCSTCKYYRLPINVKCTECWHPWEKWEPDKKLEEKEEQKPYFIKKYHIDTPQIIHHIEDSGMDKYITRIIDNIQVVSIERHDQALIDGIINIAREEGTTDLYILTKESIVEALCKQIPLPLNDGCPKCHYNMREEDYCPGCGQKIMKDALGYNARKD